MKDLERRVQALESSPCKDGHSFAEATGTAECVLFCSRCGTTKTIGAGPGRRIGFHAGVPEQLDDLIEDQQ